MRVKELLGFEVNEIDDQNLETLIEKRKELVKKVRELQQELLKRRVEAKMGTLKNTASIRNTRKDIARILTILTILNKEIEKKKKESKK